MASTVKNIVPCKDCENKGCGAYHDKCEKYLQFIKSNEETKKRQHKYNIKITSQLKDHKPKVLTKGR